MPKAVNKAEMLLQWMINKKSYDYQTTTSVMTLIRSCHLLQVRSVCQNNWGITLITVLEWRDVMSALNTPTVLLLFYYIQNTVQGRSMSCSS